MRRRQLALRRWRDKDLKAAEKWLGAAEAGCLDARVKAGTDESPPGFERSAITLDGELKGLADVADWRGLRLIGWLLLAPEVRGWGYGSEAVRQLEASGARTAALAFADEGLSLYFWLRLGYAPSTEQPHEGMLLMTRTIANEGV